MSHEPKADWFSVSTRLLRDRKVQVLIRRHGHEVSSTVIALFAQARLQRQAGEVETTFYDLAHDALTTEEKVQEIVRSADELGFVKIDEQDEIGVILHFPAWKRHQNTASQQRSREARKATNHADVIDCHQVSPNVVLHDMTGEDKTEQKKPAPLTRAEFPLSFLLSDLMAGADPDGKVTPPTRTWAVEEERLLRIDGRDPEKAANLMRWTWGDSFWRGKVRSMKKFRAQYGQLHEDATKDWRKANRGKRSVTPAVQQTLAEQMAEALPEIPKPDIDMHIYRLQQGKHEVTPESIRERHEATKKVAA